MKANTVLIFAIGLLIVIGGGMLLYSKSKGSAPATQMTETQNQPSPSVTTKAQPSGMMEEKQGDAAKNNNAMMGETKIDIQNFAFNPATITVKKGTTITWTNKDSMAHNVTASDGSFKSPTLNKDQSFSFTFNKTGTFDYVCTFHPNMKGTVVVE